MFDGFHLFLLLVSDSAQDTGSTSKSPIAVLHSLFCNKTIFYAPRLSIPWEVTPKVHYHGNVYCIHSTWHNMCTWKTTNICWTKKNVSKWIMPHVRKLGSFSCSPKTIGEKSSLNRYGRPYCSPWYKRSRKNENQIGRLTSTNPMPTPYCMLRLIFTCFFSKVFWSHF